MILKLSTNKLVIIIFGLTLITTSILLFILFKKQTSTRNIAQTPTPTSTSIQPRVDEVLTKSVGKKTDPNTNTVYYSLNVVLKGNIGFEYETGNALGKFYLPEDPAKNLFSFSLTSHDGKYYVGSFPQGLDSSSTWQYVDKNKLIELTKDGSEVQIRGTYMLIVPGNLENTKKIDKAFKDVNLGTLDQNEVNNFVFQASSMGFTN